jgi:hypothetical protein
MKEGFRITHSMAKANNQDPAIAFKAIISMVAKPKAV